MGGNIIQINSKNSGRRRFSKRGNHRLMSEINVTPFVDVMLVLLIIFMVAAPLLTVGVEINLPKTSANALPTEKEQPLTLSITKEKELYLQETKIDFDIKLVCFKSKNWIGNGQLIPAGPEPMIATSYSESSHEVKFRS